MWPLTCLLSSHHSWFSSITGHLFRLWCDCDEFGFRLASCHVLARKMPMNSILFEHMSASSIKTTPVWYLRCWNKTCMTFSNRTSSALCHWNTLDQFYSKFWLHFWNLRWICSVYLFFALFIVELTRGNRDKKSHSRRYWLRFSWWWGFMMIGFGHHVVVVL